MGSKILICRPVDRPRKSGQAMLHDYKFTMVISMLLMSCSSDAKVTNVQRSFASQQRDGKVANAQSSSQKVKFMTTKKSCKNDQFSHTKCMIELILQDLEMSGDGVGGGGVSEIKQIMTETYTVSLPMEERTQIYTYKFDVQPELISIESKTSSVKSH